ncbi:MAG: bifunctional DNA-formamidopyrimidine glycosylase/DNA-(apurinic or apyrimidinic site) lyase [Pseudomonadota bacterium]
MPELPEVESNLRNLRRWMTDRTIVEVSPPPGIRETGGVKAEDFVALLAGKRVVALERRGKWILLSLSDGVGLGLHLGMTGRLAMVASGAGEPRFTRAVFRLDDGSRVCFVDSRRFGKLIAAARLDDLVEAEEISKLGPDPLSGGIDTSLRSACQRTSRSIKEVIMDQRVIAGVGNLYATEALWHARIHPSTSASEVAKDSKIIAKLVDGIRTALEHGLSVYAHENVPQYLEEGAPNVFNAYDRAGQPCPRCETPIASMVLGGRTTAYCPTCQREKKGGRTRLPVPKEPSQNNLNKCRR